KKMSSEVARVYRDILKAVVKHVGKEDHKSHFTDFVKRETEEMKRVLGKSAASVGLRLPEVYQP
ncbi:hypothetical protein HID58_038072, partial [Brassica napus]